MPLDLPGNETKAATRNLLVELLVEELPPKSLKKLGDSFAEACCWPEDARAGHGRFRRYLLCFTAASRRAYQKRGIAGAGQICFAQTDAGSGRPGLKRPGHTRTAQETERSCGHSASVRCPSSDALWMAR